MAPSRRAAALERAALRRIPPRHWRRPSGISLALAAGPKEEKEGMVPGHDQKTACGSCANHWMSRDTGTRAETWRGLKGTTLSIYRLVRDLVALKSLMIGCFLQHEMFYNGTSNSRKFVRASERPPIVYGRTHQHNRFDYDGNISKTMYASAYSPIYTHPPTAIKPRTSSSAARFK